MPAEASPAIASPAITATATGRNTGRIRASAAAGNSTPLLSTSLRSAGPEPGRGAMPVALRKMPTTTGSPARRVMVTQVRGRRSSLVSSTPITSRPPRPSPRGPGDPRRVGGASGEGSGDGNGSALGSDGAPPVSPRNTSSSVGRSRASSLMRRPWPTSRRLTASAGSPLRCTRRWCWSSHSTVMWRVRQEGRGLRGVGRLDAQPSGRRQQRVDPVLGDQLAVGHHGRPRADQLDLGEEVAGQEHGRPLVHELDEQRPELVDALRVEAVGRLVEDQQARLAQEGRSQAEPLAHAHASRP